MKNCLEIEVLEGLKQVVRNHEKYSKCYFWTPPQNASARRQMEFSVDIDFEGLCLRQDLDCSCKNIYYSLDVRSHGKKKDVRLVKSIIKALEIRKG